MPALAAGTASLRVTCGQWQWSSEGLQYLNSAIAVGVERWGRILEPLRKCDSQDLERGWSGWEIRRSE